MMQLRGVSKSYALGESRVEALSEINLTIDDGDYLTIEGPSGSGKSTLLSILGCLERPTRGEYYLDERAVHEMGDRELSFARARTFGFVLQSFHLIPQLTALGNVMLPMRYVGMRKAERRERARALLAMVGLAERASHRPSQLSGGEQQRVAVARALANDPKVILADEPTGNLDTEMGEEIVGLLESFWKDGKALVIVTHNPEIARRSPKCIRLRNGRVESVLAENAQAG